MKIAQATLNFRTRCHDHIWRLGLMAGHTAQQLNDMEEFAFTLRCRANPATEPAPAASSPETSGAHPGGRAAGAAPPLPRVAQPNYAALGLGSAEEAEGRN